MSDEWSGNAVKKIQQAEEDKKRKEAFELMRERKLSASEHEMFSGLQNSLKGAIEKFNNLMADKNKRLTVEGVRYDEITIKSFRSEVSLDLKFDFDTHELNYDFYRRGLSRDPEEGKIPLGFNEEGEVRFVFDGRAIAIEKLTESLLDTIIDNSIV